MEGFAMLVFIVDTATKAPKRYDPPSPRKICALGKLNQRKNVKITIVKNKKLANSELQFKKLIKNKFTRIIKE